MPPRRCPSPLPAPDGAGASHLTLPVSIEPSGLPLVLFVHGGPWTWGSWGDKTAAQILANRGGAVLQVDVRGSTG
ncbi:hypothetical protein OG413_39335 [Streptomyces sp. NBC_01433]|uniref:alpha/beta hydrolase family protein n=1 Tax=Streptomyces sp. NBC_01433 TaxID=2903864 RepID=UPI00225027AD|nr:hypothetical protein [Streptomyces sp. NBC_01433]MCX4681257.1 hypothetical protein [Streptomyces sp. NBC_01433]